MHTLHDLTDPLRKFLKIGQFSVYFDQMFLKIIPKIFI